MKHQIREVTKDGVITKCGRLAAKADVSVWSSDIDCDLCLGRETPLQQASREATEMQNELGNRPMGPRKVIKRGPPRRTPVADQAPGS